eukprot:CAMPEP_0206469984 /NCGR_PEP_ID=MMETSP0324_2-20121206/30628_1 /ASSEMBLY_ACC=CAM_ASM_000836 /TAXON_ID=2866 /ORGANISM="Crypthecodinium cohnii, Strain Seligo" /LENGTH=303 /DNA_ID=CAMNT_0053943893 /DNA_START=380 /DNA_END=1291 /DNA_ORIENTATION=+
MAAWSYIGSVAHSRSLLVKGDPEWCALFTTVRMWLILLSALWTAALALGTLAALLGSWQQVKLLGYTTVGVVPLSLVMCVYNLWEPCHPEVSYGGAVDCGQSSTAVAIECAEQTLILAFVVFVLVFARCSVRDSSERSVERRSVRIVSRYLAAYIASYGAWILARWPLLQRRYGETDWWPIFVSISWRLLVSNGAFNFLALWLHARDSVQELHWPPLHVPILGEDKEVEVSTVQFKQVDYHKWGRTVKSEVAQIQNANQRMWKELGLTFDQGVSGEDEPLTEQDLADHFPSILSSKFGRVSVT